MGLLLGDVIISLADNGGGGCSELDYLSASCERLWPLHKTCHRQNQLALYPGIVVLLTPIFPSEIIQYVVPNSSMSSQEGVLI